MTFSVGLLGHGTVGSAFHELLGARADSIERSVGMRPEIAGILTTSQGDFDEILERSDLVVELIGGVEPAREYILRALGAGKHVVTANKQVLSQHGEEVYAAARESGVQLRFEAAVGGVVPAIRVVHETLAAAHIERVHGIVNGTTNFILTEMTRTGATYEDALAEAQRLGFAEADPTLDVSGGDAAQKLCVLAQLAFGARVKPEEVLHARGDHALLDLDGARLLHVAQHDLPHHDAGAEPRLDLALVVLEDREHPASDRPEPRHADADLAHVLPLLETIRLELAADLWRRHAVHDGEGLEPHRADARRVGQLRHLLQLARVQLRPHPHAAAEGPRRDRDELVHPRDLVPLGGGHAHDRAPRGAGLDGAAQEAPRPVVEAVGVGA